MKFITLLLCLGLSLAASAAIPSSYRIGAGDIVRIQVYEQADLKLEAPVNEAGKLNFPLLGQITVAGLTLTEVEQKIAEQLRSGGFVLAPQVNAQLIQYRSQRISVFGEVNNSGRYALDSATSVVEALALAGGINSAGGDLIVLTRQGQHQQILLSDLMTQASAAQEPIFMQNGDVLYVPRQPMVYVHGEVTRPGNLKLEKRMTALQAIASAGGYNQRASQGNIKLSRKLPNGEQTDIKITESEPLQDGDVVYVNERWF